MVSEPFQKDAWCSYILISDNRISIERIGAHNNAFRFKIVQSLRKNGCEAAYMTNFKSVSISQKHMLEIYWCYQHVTLNSIDNFSQFKFKNIDAFCSAFVENSALVARKMASSIELTLHEIHLRV